MGPLCRTAVTLTVLVTAASRPFAAGERHQTPVNPQAATTKAFTDRVADYVELHKKVAGTLPKLDETADAAKLAAQERALADAIANARAAARLGDIFGADFRPIALQLLRADWARRSAAEKRALFTELPPKTTLRVNMRYPTTYPLVTAPSRLLAQLPDLPDELEYRLFGRHLILRDTKANIIVDAIVDALPSMS